MKKKIVIVVITVLVAAVLLTCGFLFNVRNIEVGFGNDVTITDEAEILSHAGIEIGTNILALDEKAVKENIENAYRGEIEVVDVVRSFPDTVTVKVRERVALFRIPVFETESYVLPDKDFQRTTVFTSVPADGKYITVTGFAVVDTFSEKECYVLHNIAEVLLENGFSETAIPYFVKEIRFSEEEILVSLFDGAELYLSLEKAKADFSEALSSYLQLSETEREKFSNKKQ